MGSYSLSPDYSFAAIPLDMLITLSATSPADIVTKIRSSQESVNGSMKSDTDINDVEEQVDTETVSTVNDDIETGGTTSDSIDNASEASQYSRARYGITASYHML